MFKLIIILVIVILALVIHNNHIRIKWPTFFKRGFRANRGKWGIYCYTGKQGNFKSYSCIEALLTQFKDMKIYSNVHSIKGVEYTPIGGFDDLLSLRFEHDCVILFDEIFTALTRTSKMTTEILDFLSQMRKRHIILLTTAQEWLEINITLRRYCRYRIDCQSFNLPFITLIIKRFYDAENMKWSNEDNDYVAPLLETTISKTNRYVADSYDTFEQIPS